jgi:hypothetical protein
MENSDDDPYPIKGFLLAFASLLIILPLLTVVFDKVSAEGGVLADDSPIGLVNSPDGIINVVVVRSLNPCTSIGVFWSSLNSNWPLYGDTPISIDYNNPDFCNGPITYSNLVASGADVLVLSDVAGAASQFTPAEIAAILAYAELGHNIIGSYLMLQYDVIDNRGLAPIFGLSSSIVYTATDTASSPTYLYLEPANPLFNNIPGTYTSSGFPYSQVPLNDGTWDNADLVDARFVAKTADNTSVITVHDAPNYSAFYITNLPEYGGGTVDEIFFYNAFTYVKPLQVYLPATLK